MAEEKEKGKMIGSYDVKVPEDTDMLLGYDVTANKVKNFKFSGIWTWLIPKLKGSSISDLNTTNKTVVGAINELNSNFKKNNPTFSSSSPYKDKTIVAFGDSILAGWGWKEGTGIIQPLKEKYTDATWINKAESGANMAVTSSPAHTPIVNQVTSYTGAADAIILNGGVNDKNNGLPIGSIETNYDASYNTSTFCGALERSLQYIMDRYPLAVKLYLIPHSFGKDNSYLDSIYEKAIEICKKWNMPYLDIDNSPIVNYM